MQARVKQSSRYGVITAFSGVEFLKRDWRPVPKGFEEAARHHELLEVLEGKEERQVVEKRIEESIVKTTKARLVESHKDNSIRTFGGLEYVKDEWRDVPSGYEELAEQHELLLVWKADEAEPRIDGKKGKSAKSETPSTKRNIFKSGKSAKAEAESDENAGEE